MSIISIAVGGALIYGGVSGFFKDGLKAITQKCLDKKAEKEAKAEKADNEENIASDEVE